MVPPVEYVNMTVNAGCRILATSNMKLFANYLLTALLSIVTRSSILDITRVLDPPLHDLYGHLSLYLT